MDPPVGTRPVNGAPSKPAAALLRTLADRVRRLRKSLGLTRGELSRRSGLSIRYLARVEAGEGNISVIRLEGLARALGTTPDRLVRPALDGASPIVLVGLRGAGKSTVGPLLAERLGLPFHEVDALLRDACGLPLDQIFELHGERYYRRLEREILQRLLASGAPPAVVAAAGGVVNEPDTWEMLCERARVVWLRAEAEDHWNRVVSQGDRRPMADNPGAMQELRAMLLARERIYSEAAVTVDTSRHSPEETAERIEQALGPGGTIEEAST